MTTRNRRRVPKSFPLRASPATLTIRLPILNLDSGGQKPHSNRLSTRLPKFVGPINPPFHYPFMLAQQVTTKKFVRWFCYRRGAFPATAPSPPSSCPACRLPATLPHRWTPHRWPSHASARGARVFLRRQEKEEDDMWCHSLPR